MCLAHHSVEPVRLAGLVRWLGPIPSPPPSGPPMWGGERGVGGVAVVGERVLLS